MNLPPTSTNSVRQPSRSCRITRLQGLGATAGLWFTTLLWGIASKKLGFGVDKPFLLMLAASGLLGGYVTSFAFSRTGASDRVCSGILLAYAGIGIYRMLHGDRDGIFVVLLLGGTAVGNLLLNWLPAPEKPEADTPRDAVKEN